MGDENMAVLVEVDGRNLKEARDRSNALIIDPDEVVQFDVSCSAVGDSPIRLDEFRIVFVVLDFDAFSSTQFLDLEAQQGTIETFSQRMDLKNALSFGDLQLFSGIYKLRIEISYSVEGRTVTLESGPFYVKLRTNPLMTVTGLVATAGSISAGISMVTLARSVKDARSFELDRSIRSTSVIPTEKLMSFYKGKLALKTQKEAARRMLYLARRTGKMRRCPSCASEWPENRVNCRRCGLRLEEAEEMYSKLLRERCLDACEKLSMSVSGLQISQIAQSLGEGVPVTIDVTSVLVNSGLAFVEPHIGKRLKAPTRRLVLTGLSLSVFACLWIQANGLGSISLLTLLIAILTGTILPMLISRALDSRIHSSIDTFWKERLKQTRDRGDDNLQPKITLGTARRQS
ncbi:MAG: hypothetical protein ACE5OO_01065 [Candidatus Bathyarchaeia archaeon]